VARSKQKTSAKQNANHTTSSSSESFFTFRFTVQTVYWLILSIFVLGLGIWVTYLNVKVQQLYDQIEMRDSQAHISVVLYNRD